MHNTLLETDATELVEEVRAYCIANQDPKKALRYARFFTEGYDSWGLDKDHPFFTAKRPEWLERYRDLGLDGFFEAAEMLLASGKYEESGTAIWFLMQLLDQFDGDSAGHLAALFQAGIRNWAHTDVLSGEVIAPLLAGGRIELEELAGWRGSALKFQRRAVPVSMLGLLETKAPVGPLLKFLRPLMLDNERVVQQGLGWFLREAWKKYPKPVEAFLKEWKDQSPRLIFQYATEKMTPQQRARFRRGAIPSRAIPRRARKQAV